MKNQAERSMKYCEYMNALFEASCTLLLTEPDLTLYKTDENWFCNKCNNANCQRINTLHYGCSQAYRWNGKYIFYCPQGLVFIASSLSNDQGNLSGGILVGPIVMGDLQDTLEMIPQNYINNYIAKLPSWDTVKVHHIEEILAAVTDSLSFSSHGIYGNFIYEQEKLLSDLYEMKNVCNQDKNDHTFLILSEKNLNRLISSQDKEGTQKLLNELLGYIYFTGESDTNTIKARILELLVLLSRAAIDAGANIQEILLFNEGNIKKIEEISSIEELNIWITAIMHRFIKYSFDFTNVKHYDVLHKAMQYIKENYHKKITLDDIASHVYLSRSYVSSMFKEEIGEGLFSYVNNIRIEKSKTLLLNESISIADVGGFCGFEDQSYFTKVFKNITGVSPKKYRDTRGKIAPN